MRDAQAGMAQVDSPDPGDAEQSKQLQQAGNSLRFVGKWLAGDRMATIWRERVKVRARPRILRIRRWISGWCGLPARLEGTVLQGIGHAFQHARSSRAHDPCRP